MQASYEGSGELVKKLAEACDAVGGVEKKGKNREQGYAYQRATDVAKAIRHELFQRGIVVLPHEHEPKFEPFETKSGSKQLECRIHVTYRIMGCGSEIAVDGFGVGRDSGDKAIWKAKTGALKYFLRGLGLIPDEKEDPEYDGSPADEEAGEMHSADYKPKGSLTVAGIIVDEKQKDEDIWYKLKTLTNEGETEIKIKSSLQTDSGRLADQVGKLVSLKVLPTNREDVFLLIDVLQVRTPEPEKTESRGALSEKQIKRLYAIRNASGLSEDWLRERMGAEGAEHVSELSKKAYDAICEEMEQEKLKA